MISDNILFQGKAKTCKRRMLFSQPQELMAETPTGSPEKTSDPLTSAQTCTKLVKTSSNLLIAQITKKKVQKNILDKKISEKDISKKNTKKNGQESQTRLINPGRRSSADFVQKNGSGMRVSKDRIRNEVLFTSCSPEDVALGKELASKFPSGLLRRPFVVAKSVTATTTHVVCGESKRTLNILRGMLRGCWILSKSWLYESLESGGWVDEEPFELADFSPAIISCRLDREAFGGSSYKSKLFSECGPILISAKRKLQPSRVDLIGLVRLGGGSVANLRRVATIIVGEGESGDPNSKNQIFVGEKWILDSIQFNALMPFDDYKIDC